MVQQCRRKSLTLCWHVERRLQTTYELNDVGSSSLTGRFLRFNGRCSIIIIRLSLRTGPECDRLLGLQRTSVRSVEALSASCTASGVTILHTNWTELIDIADNMTTTEGLTSLYLHCDREFRSSFLVLTTLFKP